LLKGKVFLILKRAKFSRFSDLDIGFLRRGRAGLDGCPGNGEAAVRKLGCGSMITGVEP
jgi:hypothetical protein